MKNEDVSTFIKRNTSVIDWRSEGIPGVRSHQSQLGVARSRWEGPQFLSSNLEGSLQTFAECCCDTNTFLLTSSSPFLSILSLQQSPRIFDVLDSGGFWRVGLDQHAHVPHHLKIWDDKGTKIQKIPLQPEGLMWKIWGREAALSSPLHKNLKTREQRSGIKLAG